MVRDLDLDPGSGQGHVTIHSTCRATCTPNHVTVALRSPKYGHLNFVKYRHSAKFELSWYLSWKEIRKSHSGKL